MVICIELDGLLVSVVTKMLTEKKKLNANSENDGLLSSEQMIVIVICICISMTSDHMEI